MNFGLAHQYLAQLDPVANERRLRTFLSPQISSLAQQPVRDLARREGVPTARSRGSSKTNECLRKIMGIVAARHLKIDSAIKSACEDSSKVNHRSATVLTRGRLPEREASIGLRREEHIAVVQREGAGCASGSASFTEANPQNVRRAAGRDRELHSQRLTSIHCYRPARRETR
jgi:hypothetical protein